jgi:hypothetical protein
MSSEGTGPAASAAGGESPVAVDLWSRLGRFHQVGIVVADLDLAIAEMRLATGVPAESWEVFDSQDRQTFTYLEGGAERFVRLRWARAASGPTAYQLTQPLGGESIWSRALAENRTMFAAGYFVKDFQGACDQLCAAGATEVGAGQVEESGRLYRYSFLRLPATRLLIEVMSQA